MKLESFIGKATLAVDANGRTNLPKEFRKALPESDKGQVVVTMAQGRTLALYPLSDWNRYAQELETLGRDPAASRFRMRIMAMAKLSALDAQNRIALTGEQMEYAGLKGEVTFVGDGKRIRLWTPDRYAAEVEASSPGDESRFGNFF